MERFAGVAIAGAGEIEGDGQGGKAFNPMAAGPEVRAFAQPARSQSTEAGLLASSIGAYFSLCGTPAGTFERAWLAAPLLDLEHRSGT